MVVRTRVRYDLPVPVGVAGEHSRPAVERAFTEAGRREVGLISLHSWDFPEIPRSLL